MRVSVANGILLLILLIVLKMKHQGHIRTILGNDIMILVNVLGARNFRGMLIGESMWPLGYRPLRGRTLL